MAAIRAPESALILNFDFLTAVRNALKLSKKEYVHEILLGPKSRYWPAIYHEGKSKITQVGRTLAISGAALALAIDQGYEYYQTHP